MNNNNARISQDLRECLNTAKDLKKKIILNDLGNHNVNDYIVKEAKSIIDQSTEYTKYSNQAIEADHTDRRL